MTGESIRISAMYRCHDIPKSEFVNSVKKFLVRHRSVKNHCIFGDFNIDILENNIVNLENSDRSISYESVLNYLESEYVPYFRGITRSSLKNEMGTCIDNCFAKTQSIEIESIKLNTPFNDHYPLFISIDQIKIQKTSETDNKCTNYRKLKNIAENLDWQIVLTILDPNEALNKLIQIIHDCLEALY